MIERIIIKGLFHKFDYDIPLKNVKEEPVTFITGCNGMGKTTILNMVEAVLTANFDALFSIPFNLFQIKGDEYIMTTIPVRGEQNLDDSHYDDPDTSAGSQDTNYKYIKLKFKIGQHETEDNLYFGKSGSLTSSMVMLLKTEGCCHIRDSRIAYKEDKGVSRISSDSAWLKEKLTAAKDLITKALMPLSNIRHDIDMDSVPDDILIELYWLLVGYEIFPMVARVELAKDSRDYKDVVETMRKVYPVIWSDKNISGLLKGLFVFEKIISSYAFIDKELEISTRYGFRFKTTSDKIILRLDQLSSGEQHLVIQMFELLFRAKKGSVILIDEPEISLHPGWQMDYLTNLKSIARVRRFQYIVATHQPMMFNNDFDKAVDLYKLSNPDIFK